MTLLRRCWGALSDVFSGVPADPRAMGSSSPASVGGGGVAEVMAQLRRHPRRLVAAGLATVVAPAIVSVTGAVGTQGRAGGPVAVTAAAVPIPVAGDGLTWIPAARRAAATCPGLPSSVLVAMADVESSFGLNAGTSPAGAVGPMQFLPSTWAAYAADGDGDGFADVMNPVDAIHGAARLLCANGGADPERLRSAVWNYNRSDDYVRQVLTLARFTPV